MGTLTRWAITGETDGGEVFGMGLLVFDDVVCETPPPDFVTVASCSSILCLRSVSFFMSSSSSLVPLLLLDEEEVWLLADDDVAPPPNVL